MKDEFGRELHKGMRGNPGVEVVGRDKCSLARPDIDQSHHCLQTLLQTCDAHDATMSLVYGVHVP